MSYAAKKRAVVAFLVCFSVWPLAHRWLVASYDVDPWRLGGWAMYCTPKLRVEVGMVPEREGRPVDLELPDSLRRSADRFTQYRAVLGRFSNPERLAREALEQLEVDSVVVTVRRDRLDPRSGRVAGTREYFRYGLDEKGRVTGGRFSVRDLP